MKFLQFSPQTTGEHLFLLIVRELYGIQPLANLQALAILAVGGRTDQFADYFLGLSTFNVLARLVKKAERVRAIDNEALHHSAMVAFIQGTLGIPRHPESDMVDRLAEAALKAAADSKRKIRDAVKNSVCNGRKELSCYICGRTLLRQSADPDTQVEFEHLWPASFGGNSIEENLLPACTHCNGAKGHMLLWHTAHIASFVLKPQPSEEELKAISRQEKIAKHTRNIYARACDDRCSLKTAALSIGPVNMTSIYADDKDDAMDFFNFGFK
jgi:5-methylcytosine-specific restriction endonuclease McrA